MIYLTIPKQVIEIANASQLLKNEHKYTNYIICRAALIIFYLLHDEQPYPLQSGMPHNNR